MLNWGMVDPPIAVPPEPQKKPRKEDLRGSYYRKLQVARYHFLGKSAPEIAGLLGYKHPGSVRNLLANDEEVRALIQDMQHATREQFVEDLTFAQHVAFRGMLDLAVKAKNEKVRFDAQQHLLNMAGEPGKPTDRSESKRLSLSGEAGAAALIANALRDPGVRALLQTNPELKGLLKGAAQDEGSTQGVSERVSEAESAPKTVLSGIPAENAESGP